MDKYRVTLTAEERADLELLVRRTRKADRHGGGPELTPLQTPLWLPQSAMAIGMLLLCFALIRTMVTKARILRRGDRS